MGRDGAPIANQRRWDNTGRNHQSQRSPAAVTRCSDCREMTRLVLFIVSMAAVISPSNSALSPNIIIIIADDMGWNDVSYHGTNEIPTPNIDALAYNGVILNKHYVQPLCSPSRGALMTGLYPIHLGMQGMPFLHSEDRGLPVTHRILPQYLRRLGYSTHGIGKWHLGFSRKELLPTRRGFDSFFGYYNGFISYYDHISEFVMGSTTISGHDFRRNETNAWDRQGRYATDEFTEEAETIIRNHDAQSRPLFLYLAHLAVHAGNEGKLLEAPQEDINLFRHISDPNRRTYAAMVHRLDQSVGRVTRALEARGMLSNSIIVFMSDNGAQTRGDTFRNWGSNYPLRGVKETLWEGGVRVPAFIWSPRILDNSRVSNDLFHVSDWLPTLYAAAGGNAFDLPPMDGKNQWRTITHRQPSSRDEILVNIDEVARTASLIQGPWKFVVGTDTRGALDSHYGAPQQKQIPYSYEKVFNSMAARAIASSSLRSSRRVLAPVVEWKMQSLRSQATVYCGDRPNDGPNPTRNGSLTCLYDLESDPCERKNLLHDYPFKADDLKNSLRAYYLDMVKQDPLVLDPRGSDPRKFLGAWTPWLPDSGNGLNGFTEIGPSVAKPPVNKKPAISSVKSFIDSDESNATDGDFLTESWELGDS